MLNGIYGLGQGIRNAPDRYAREADDYANQAQGLRERAVGMGAPRMGGVNQTQLILGAIASLFDPTGQAGNIAAQGIQANRERDYENQVQNYRLGQQALQTQAEGLDLRARQADQRLGRFQDASQFAQQQAFRNREAAADRMQFNQKLQQDQDQFDRDIAYKTKALEGRLTGTQWQQLMKMPPEARAGFASTYLGINDQGLLDSLGRMTASENLAGVRAQDIQATQQPRIDNLNARTDNTREQANDRRAFREGRKNLILQNIRTSAARAANLAAVTSFLDEKMAVEFARADAYVTGVLGGLENQRYGQEVEMRGQDLNAMRDALSTNSTQVNTLRGNLSTLRANIAKDPKNADLRKQEQLVLAKVLELGERDKQIRAAIQAASAQRPTAPQYGGSRVPRTNLPRIDKSGPLGQGEVPPFTPEVNVEKEKPKTNTPKAPPKKAPSLLEAKIGGEGVNALRKVFAAQAAQLRKDAAEAIRRKADPKLVNAELKKQLAKIGYK